MTKVTATVSSSSTLPLGCRAILDHATTSASVRGFVREALGTVGRRVDALYLQIQITNDSEVIEDHYTDGTADPDFWQEVTSDIIHETLVEGEVSVFVFRKHSSDQMVVALSVPLEDAHRSTIGALAAIVICTAESIPERLAQLYLLGNTIGQSRDRVGEAHQPTIPVPTVEPRSGPSPSQSKALRTAGNYESRHELAFGLVNQLKTKSSSDQVAIGLVRGRAVQILAISGFDEVKRRSPGVVRIRQAMEECVDQKAPIRFHTSADWEEETLREYRLHRQWHDAAGGDCVASIPLLDGNACRYVIALRRGHTRPYSEGELAKYRELLEPYAPVLDVVERANRSFAQHAIEQARDHWASVTSPGHWVRKVALIVFVAMALWFTFGTRNYRMAVPAVVVPSEVRNVSAPAQGTLREVLVVPGDRITRGQVLCRFDSEALELERDRIQHEIARAQIELRGYRADRDPVGVRLTEARIESLDASLATVLFEIERATVTAAHDGILIRGDLRRRIGDIVQAGELLFELSADGVLRIDAHVSESEIEVVIAGLEGRFSPFSRPDQEFPIAVDRVAPSSTQHDGRNVYVVEARLDEQESWMRAGMEGVAFIDAGPQPVWWISLHRLINAIRLGFWM
ncbi:MAG: HlyD family efflux transporter periplasmic adaptor subunit [Planctomycetes bacterium]|nr:HlyD family efflux transporter periplasmic adaptor subunit [Planctomycetota bacterium]